jgi:hypothetical protein
VAGAVPTGAEPDGLPVAGTDCRGLVGDGERDGCGDAVGLPVGVGE